MISAVKSFVKSNTLVSTWLSYFYNRGQNWKPPITDINKLVDKIFRNKKNVFFIQVGANDGVSGCDHIRQNVITKGWSGILVEPVPHIFKKLVKNYEGQPLISFENAAIGTKDGTQVFYHFDESMSSWHNELGSFKKEILSRHGIENVDELIKELQVPVIAFTSLLKKYNITHLNILNIDTEGYDYEILKTIDFSFVKPSVIIYEHRHLSTEDYKASIQLLNKHDYILFSEFGCDTLAVSASLL